jgi:ADP-ribosylglycohydrolase
MVSDDTEHTCLTAQALLRAPHDVDAFARSLSWGLRFWLLGLPAGVGWATLRAVGKLWLGFPPSRAGVYSAGNGPAMRATVLGVCLGDDSERLAEYVRVSTRLTHTDARAERAALVVALAAHQGVIHGPEACADTLPQMAQAVAQGDLELQGLLTKAKHYLEQRRTAEELADAMGLQRGVTGYAYHSVPLALYCWLRHPDDFRGAMEEAIDLGGDTDSVGAIVGGIAGATVGASGIPDEWLHGLFEWPRSVAWMRRLAERLANIGGEPGALPCFWPGLIPRNAVFLSVLILHVLRRLLPPY